MDLIQEINAKYLALEAEIDKRLEKVKIDEEKLEKQSEKLNERTAQYQNSKVLSFDEAFQRNANILKSLEIAKARLRSRTTFTPMEKVLEQALKNYKKDLEAVGTQQSVIDPESKSHETREQLISNNNENIYELVMQKESTDAINNAQTVAGSMKINTNN